MVKVAPAATGLTKVVLGPCHYRAIHSGHDRSRADNHGQRHGALDLRRSPTSQVTTSSDLALGAGGRLPEAVIGLAVPRLAVAVPGRRGTGNAVWRRRLDGPPP
jgi:hypothetical protein